jgi:hypothetical protein
MVLQVTVNVSERNGYGVRVPGRTYCGDTYCCDYGVKEERLWPERVTVVAVVVLKSKGCGIRVMGFHFRE